MESIIANWAAGQLPQPTQLQQLIDYELSDRRSAKAWGITPETAEAKLKQRAQLLQALIGAQAQFPLAYQQWTDLIPLLWFLWLPLGLWLAEARQSLARPLVQGILGGQGTGKTTLTQILSLILKQLGYRTVCLSIDDLYKTYAERQQLREQDPRLIWRGPPGTHNIELGLKTLEQLQQAQPAQPVDIPRFDKSAHGGEGDRVAPEQVSDIDIVLFEGWFVGVRPIAPEQFLSPPAPITSAEDKAFAKDMNQALQEYLPLWDKLDRLIVLYPEDYRLCQQWRRQAEQDMKATGRAGMSDEKIDQFVAYFWCALHPELFIKPLVDTSGVADLVIEIRSDHTPAAIYSP
ncbi:glycerate kinase [Almyronema epifaneia]|uniref:Glycerate kinase n=1 Tax=Almyronema epifaneia S1 TaxID=2991925 RepID=A0ABW6IBF4_9CYAN